MGRPDRPGKRHHPHTHPDKRPKISLIIPFSTKNAKRRETFEWLLEYWKNELPDAEIVIGKSRSRPFCKGEALNNAFRRSHGKVLVMLDADAYMEGRILDHAADRILLDSDDHLWFVPYRRLWRLTEEASEEILESDPKNPFRPSDPPPPEDIDGNSHSHKYGHRYGAMAMVFPREALEVLGCFDERFKGWGGEDIALLRALDTLYGKHKTTNNAIFHLWHPFNGRDVNDRTWDGQETSNPNAELAARYNRANRNPTKMRELVDEGCRHRKRRFWPF